MAYDAAGNMTNDGLGNTYTYDAENRLTAVTGTNPASYVYDAFGHRVRSTVNGNPYDFIFDRSGRELDEVTASSWVWGHPGGARTITYANSATYFDHTDWLGTVRARSNVSGTSVETCTSLPFGDAQSCTGTDYSPLHYTGQQLDSESNLHHFPFRQLSTTQGRWTATDPAGFDAADITDPSSWNRYAYVGNDPAGSFDPLGLKRPLISIPGPGQLPPLGQLSGDNAVIWEMLTGSQILVAQLVAAPGTTFISAVNGLTYTVGDGNVWLGPNGETLSGSSMAELRLPSLDPIYITLVSPVIDLDLSQYRRGTVLAPATGPKKKGLLGCSIETANKLTISNALGLQEGSWGRFAADSLGGGNTFTGLITAGQTLFGNDASGTELAQTGAGIILDPSMGLGPALTAGGVEVPSVVGSLTDAVVEGGTGIGLIKLGYDGLSLVGSGVYCALKP